jgi:hypothetical protein
VHPNKPKGIMKAYHRQSVSAREEKQIFGVTKV